VNDLGSNVFFYVATGTDHTVAAIIGTTSTVITGSNLNNFDANANII
jgi:hypothetical protein